MQSHTGKDCRTKQAWRLTDPYTGCSRRWSCFRKHFEALSNRGRANRVLSRLALTVLLTGPPIGALPPPPADEYHVKAAFLYNFARFAEWPLEVFQGPDDPFVICVLGRDPFGHALDDVVAGRQISGRKIVVRRFSEALRVVGCRILFVSSSEPKSDLPVLADMKEQGVLTVGESGSATSAGMIINLKVEGGKIRFEIHTDPADREKLRFSSLLLSLAIVSKE
jgi:YfiR/HmsC-like